MRDDSERAEISKAKTMANAILKRAEERRQKILDQADVAAKEEIDAYEAELKKEYEKNVYDLSKYEKDLQESKRNDVDAARRDYEKHEQQVVDFLIANITNVKIEIARNIKEDFQSLNVNQNA